MSVHNVQKSMENKMRSFFVVVVVVFNGTI